MSASTFSTAGFVLPSVAFFGRRFAEYLGFFSLAPAQLRDGAVLDVAAGPSSFAAEANAAGLDVTACDPLYGCRPEALATHVQLDYRRMETKMREKVDLMPGGARFTTIDEAVGDRRAAADLFLADYAAHVAHGRYVGGALPALPFADGSFDIVLCAHLLFIYEAQLDYAFHLAACRELMRVARREVRIHPLCGNGGAPYAQLARLRAELAQARIGSELVPVPPQFFRGTDATLVLRR